MSEEDKSKIVQYVDWKSCFLIDVRYVSLNENSIIDRFLFGKRVCVS